MGDFIVVWSKYLSNDYHHSDYKSERFFDVTEDFVDGFVYSLKQAGHKLVIKERV